MSDPLSLLPLAVAAGGGRIDGFEAQQLVAAGLTLLQRSARLVRALQGRRSALLLPTSQQFLTAMAASDGRGAVLVNPLAAPAEIAYQLHDANVGAVFTNSALAPRLPDGTAVVLLDESPRSARVVIDGTASDVDLGAHFGMPLEGDAGAPGRAEEAVIVYTSAMAGSPLGAILTHRNMLANARSTGVASMQTSDDHSLALLPFSHLFGLTVSGMSPLLAGARVTTMERFHPIRALELIEREGITEVVGVPSVFAALLAALERRGGRLTTVALRLCICGGAVLPVALQDRWAEATGVELRQGYGLTEAAPVSLFNDVRQPNHRGTLGVPFPDVDVEIRAPDDVSVKRAAGDEGEICVRGDNVFAGYVRDGARGLQVADGWLRTGDLGVMNGDGTVTFRGLLKPMFTRNGFNIYPRELERVVGALPGVRSVHVRAMAEPTRENDIALDVSGTVTADEVKAWCAARLSSYKQPSAIEIV